MLFSSLFCTGDCTLESRRLTPTRTSPPASFLSLLLRTVEWYPLAGGLNGLEFDFPAASCFFNEFLLEDTVLRGYLAEARAALNEFMISADSLFTDR